MQFVDDGVSDGQEEAWHMFNERQTGSFKSESNEISNNAVRMLACVMWYSVQTGSSFVVWMWLSRQLKAL